MSFHSKTLVYVDYEILGVFHVHLIALMRSSSCGPFVQKVIPKSDKLGDGCLKALLYSNGESILITEVASHADKVLFM